MAPESKTLKPSDSNPRSNSFLSGREILVSHETPKQGQCWGAWMFDQRRLVLEHPLLDVDIEKITTPALFVNEVLRIGDKRFSEEDLGHFVRALGEILPPYTGYSRHRREPLTKWKWRRRPTKRKM